MDRMIEYMNAHFSDKYVFKYATPSDYVDAINELDHTWPSKSDDLFPYGDVGDSWWVGYFSSRPNAKSYVRAGSHLLHASSQLASVAMNDPENSPETIAKYKAANDNMMNQMGVYQHHDAVSGTAKQAVADDYALRLSKAIKQNNDDLYSELIDKEVKKITGVSSTEWKMCEKTNSTFLDCPIKDFVTDIDGSTIHMNVHNPASIAIKNLQFSVPHGNFNVQKSDGTELTDKSEVICYKDWNEKQEEM